MDPSEKVYHRVDLETAASLGCQKCMNEYETGEKSNSVHDETCPRKRPSAFPAALPAAPTAATKRKRKMPAVADEEDEDVTIDGTVDPHAPRRVGNSIDFPLSNLHPYLVCSLCQGYFRDPQTVADCLHTFCRSCLVLFFRKGVRCCPTCKASLGQDPFHANVRTDRTLQEVINKIFPWMEAKEKEEETRFYAKRGIDLKPEHKQETKSHHGQGRRRGQTSTGVGIDCSFKSHIS